MPRGGRAGDLMHGQRIDRGEVSLPICPERLKFGHFTAETV